MTTDAPAMLTKQQVIDILSAPYALDCTTADPSVLRDVPDADAFAKFGRLVLKMALGELDPARMSNAVKRELLDEIGIPVPADWAIEFRQRPDKTFVAMYPSAEMAKAAVCRLREPGGEYLLPDQYTDWVNDVNRPELEEFYEFRVGDYTLNYCR